MGAVLIKKVFLKNLQNSQDTSTPDSLFQKETLAQLFPANFAKFLRTLFGGTFANGSILQFPEQLSFSQQC